MNEDNIKSINDYLKEREKMRNNTRRNSVNPINKDNNNYSSSDIVFDEGDHKIVPKISDKPKVENKQRSNVKKTPVKKQKKNIIDNILIYLSIVLFPIFTSLFFISMHTHYLVKKPFDKICLGISILCIIMFIIGFILKIIHRDKNKSMKGLIIGNIILISFLTLIDGIITYIFIKKRLWKLIDVVLSHLKLFIIIFGIIFVLIMLLVIFTKLKKRKFKKSVKIIFRHFILTLYVLVILDGMLVIYGSASFKEWLVTTAMQTMNHQYLCKWFYSKKDIDKIMGSNYVLESGESTDASLITKEEVVTYANEYERQILEHDEGASYKMINLEVNGCKGYLAAVYDPTTVHLAVTDHIGSYGQYVTTMAKNHNAVVAINGAGFYDPGYSSSGGSPTGITISDGKIVTRGEYGTQTQSGGIIGFDREGILHLSKDLNAERALNQGITNAVTWGPFLIVNGKRSFIKGNGGWGYAARTAIGQRKDGIVLFLVVDSNLSRTAGADMVDLTDIMENYGAINAANLDGGTSSVMVEKGELISHPVDGSLRQQTRPIADSFIVVEK